MSDTCVTVVENPLVPEPQEASHDCDIAVLAYQLWEERGRPDGDPEHDWYEAESRLNGRNGSE